MFRFLRQFVLIAIAILITPYATVRHLAISSQAKQPYSLLITNAPMVDGAGNPWYRSDIGIRDGRIARIGRIDRSEARQTISWGDKTETASTSASTTFLKERKDTP